MGIRLEIFIVCAFVLLFILESSPRSKEVTEVQTVWFFRFFFEQPVNVDNSVWLSTVHTWVDSNHQKTVPCSYKISKEDRCLTNSIPNRPLSVVKERKRVVDTRNCVLFKWQVGSIGLAQWRPLWRGEVYSETSVIGRNLWKKTVLVQGRTSCKGLR